MKIKFQHGSAFNWIKITAYVAKNRVSR